MLSTPSWMAKQLVGRMLGLLPPTTRNKAAVQGRAAGAVQAGGGWTHPLPGGLPFDGA